MYKGSLGSLKRLDPLMFQTSQAFDIFHTFVS